MLGCDGFSMLHAPRHIMQILMRCINIHHILVSWPLPLPETLRVPSAGRFGSFAHPEDDGMPRGHEEKEKSNRTHYHVPRTVIEGLGSRNGAVWAFEQVSFACLLYTSLTGATVSNATHPLASVLEEGCWLLPEVSRIVFHQTSSQ